MGWLEQTIRRYEHRRWTKDDNRRVLPFEWGLEHIGGQADEPDPRGFLNQWVESTLARSDEWFATTPANDYRLADGVLNFSSAIESPWPANNLVHARFFPARNSGPAVVLLPNWNAKWDGQLDLCHWLNRLGITVLRLSLPYHDRRAVPGHERADYLVGPNIGLTLQANRQAVTDARRCLRWLGERGYTRLGILGTSIGSSISFITLAHEPALRAGAFLHVSTYFGDVVRTGMTTMHVWESLRTKVSADELRRFWAPISPFPYIERVKHNRKRCLMVSGRYDPTFWPEFSEQVLETLRSNGVQHETLVLPCGHYSLELPPFSYLAGYRLGAFFFQSLA
ncbi:MAG: hypothetical protein AUI64_04355 [Acidobacteria bacterium 13_1_40CM_2_64_6]|nr:MAG: hypothetical protein AUI64_04355 [Acidobacteria bacterium 13_1_40CM_2_64_6]